MNETVYEIHELIASVAIMTVLFCGLNVCLACLNKEAAGIKPSVLQSIPVVAFMSRVLKDGVKCVVCLSDLADGDKARVLPSCDHWFHAGCIDTWLQSHSTCPICRNKVGRIQDLDPPLGTNADSGEAYEVPAVAIDIPVEPKIGESGPVKASDLNQL